MWLSKQQLEDLTKRKTGKAQCRALDYLGIPYRVGLDGKPVVFERDLTAETDPEKRTEPNWDALKN